MKLLFISISAFFIACPVFASVEFPSFPMAFYGRAIINGSNAPVGTKIFAYDGQMLRGEGSVFSDGFYGFESSAGSKILVGKYESSLVFRIVPVNGMQCQEVPYMSAFNEGRTVNLDIMTSCKSPVTSGGGGGGGSAGGSGSVAPVIPSPIPSVVSTSSGLEKKLPAEYPETILKKENKDYTDIAKEVKGVKIVAEDRNRYLTGERKLVVFDRKFTEKSKGFIYIQVEDKGRAWYINPVDGLRYYLGRPDDAFVLMRVLGLGVKHSVITGGKIDRRLWGKILLDVEDKGKSYYIDPRNGKAYFLGRPSEAFRLMQNVGVGILNKDIRKINIKN